MRFWLVPLIHRSFWRIPKWASPAFSLRREAPMPEGFFLFTLSLILLSVLIWQIAAGFV